MDQTHNLSLPYIMPGQAQKHVTHNEALGRLDALTQLAVESRALTIPPESPPEAAAYIVPTGAGEAWSGEEGRIAFWQEGAWVFITPQTGWRAWCIDEAQVLVRSGATWVGSLTTLTKLGVNASPDDTNRLAVKSDAILLSHDDVTPGSGDVRIALNKSGTPQTASLVFQSNFSGRAEIGLAGDDGFSVKVSSDGTTFSNALSVSPATGIVSFSQPVIAPSIRAGVPHMGLAGYDRFFIDPMGGDDTADGLSIATAWKTVSILSSKLPVGRKVVVELLGDVVWDQFITFSYPIASLTFRGLASDGLSYVKRKITVTDAANISGYPATLQFECPASLYVYKVDIDLASSHSGSFFFFDSTQGFVKSYDMTVTKTGATLGNLIGSFRSFVPSHHEALTIAPSAEGHVFEGVAASGDPNSLWNFPTNITSA